MHLNPKSIRQRITKVLGQYDFENRELRALGYYGGATSELHALYRLLFGKNLAQRCGNCAQDAYFELKQITDQKLKTMSEQTRKLRKDCLIDTSFNPIPGVPAHLTNANLTDEIAEALLKASPGHAKFFEKAEVDVNHATPPPADQNPAGQGKADPPAALTAEKAQERLDSFGEQIKARVNSCNTKKDYTALLKDLDETFTAAYIQEAFGPLTAKASEVIGKTADVIAREHDQLAGKEMAVLETLKGVKVGKSSRHLAESAKSIIKKLDSKARITNYIKGDNRASVKKQAETSKKKLKK